MHSALTHLLYFIKTENFMWLISTNEFKYIYT